MCFIKDTFIDNMCSDLFWHHSKIQVQENKPSMMISFVHKFKMHEILFRLKINA